MALLCFSHDQPLKNIKGIIKHCYALRTGVYMCLPYCLPVLITKHDKAAEHAARCPSLDILERSSPKKSSVTKVPGNLVRASSRSSPMLQQLQNHCNTISIYIFIYEISYYNLALNLSIKLYNLAILTILIYSHYSHYSHS